MEAMGLYELLEQVREGLEDVFPDRVWVCAEVASIQSGGSPYRPGHCYMELCQSGPKGLVAKVRGIVWQSVYVQLSHFFRAATGGDIRPGMKVLVRAQVNFSELYGLSLVIDDIDPSYTLGDAEARRRETIARLENEGLMDAQKELPLAPLPYRLAVISARTAAGFGDFCRHLQENEYGFAYDVTLVEALMQGDGAPASIVSALSRVGDGLDAVLILRGGGSALDLSCFDDYGLCAAIANCPVPVFTAIGHDRDVHVADMVAYHSVKTPTALADLFISAFAAEDERISEYGTRLRRAFDRRIESCLSRLDHLQSRIHSADPRSVLTRGYSLVTDSRGVVVKSAASLAPGDGIKLYFCDGILNAVIDDGKQ